MQRVLVDGWTPEKAGAQFGVDGRRVARWVAAYRHHGMAALRAEAASDGAASLDRTACVLAWIGAPLRGGMKRPSRPPSAGRAPKDPTRRWN